MNVDDARARVRESGGVELAERLEHLDRNQRLGVPPDRVIAAPERGERTELDVLIAGGGLSLLYAPILAGLGLRVAIVDRARVGEAHREWNASYEELAALVSLGIVSQTELDQLIVARYRTGTCRFHGGGDYPVAGVLDCAVDAHALLALARRRAVERGVTVLDRTAVVAVGAGSRSVAVELLSNGKSLRLTTSVLVDARGASSPRASADLICPTVGGTFSGFDVGDGAQQVAPDVGEILVTTEGVECGRQHVWEAFPGRAGRTTVYLFYYARRGEPELSLVALYARLFERLASYKSGPARLERPTFGFIPGWSRLAPAPRSGAARVVLVGDAAARHSPLTFCGFGATLRSLGQASRRIAEIADGAAPCATVVDDRPIHAGTGALALLLANPPRAERRKHDLNRLLDAAFASLSEMRPGAYAALLRDEMALPEFVEFLRTTARRKPSVYVDVVRLLGARASLSWGTGVARALLAR